MQNDMIRITGGDGSSEENAIVIRNAKNEKDGVNAEYEIVAKYYGVEDIDWRLVEQYLISSDATERYYDILHIENRDGKQYTIWFDITSFYGKDYIKKGGNAPNLILKKSFFLYQ